MYEEFVKEFAEEDDDEDEQPSKAFVRGGTIQHGGRSGSSSGGASGDGAPPKPRGGRFVPYLPPPSSSTAPGGPDSGGGGEQGKQQQLAVAAVLPQQESVFQLPSSRTGKPRAMDAMLEKFMRQVCRWLGGMDGLGHGGWAGEAGARRLERAMRRACNGCGCGVEVVRRGLDIGGQVKGGWRLGVGWLLRGGWSPGRKPLGAV